MYFNIKRINLGDNKKDIVNKINYNFDQIISFSIGSEGHLGQRGIQGISGMPGISGIKGGQGKRGSFWFFEDSEPENPAYGDFWVDTNTADLEVKSLNPFGYWQNTLYYLRYSFLFKAYDNTSSIFSDRYSIGFTDSGILNVANTNLVISDSVPSLLPSSIYFNDNPYNSKFTIATLDQLDRPIISFIKHGQSSLNPPSFYWGSIGNNGSLTFKSDSSLRIFSGDYSIFSSSSIDDVDEKTDTSRMYTYPATGSFVNRRIVESPTLDVEASTAEISGFSVFIGGSGGTSGDDKMGDFNFYSSNQIESAGTLLINSDVLKLDTSTMDVQGAFYVTGYSGPSGGFFTETIFNHVRTPLYDPSNQLEEYPGIEIETQGGSGLSVWTNKSYPFFSDIFKIRGVDQRNGESIYGVNTESLVSGGIGDTKMGNPDYYLIGGTGGPYFYNVRKFKTVYREILIPGTVVDIFGFPVETSPGSVRVIPGYLDFSPFKYYGGPKFLSYIDFSDPDLWVSEILVCLAYRTFNTGYLSLSGEAIGEYYYLIMPDFLSQDDSGNYKVPDSLIYKEYTSTFRVIFNSTQSLFPPKCRGFAIRNPLFEQDENFYSRYFLISFGHSSLNEDPGVKWDSEYVDITWFNSTSNDYNYPKFFYKTSTGQSGFFDYNINKYYPGNSIASNTDSIDLDIINSPKKYNYFQP
jgi:hypothetical protein